MGGLCRLGRFSDGNVLSGHPISGARPRTEPGPTKGATPPYPAFRACLPERFALEFCQDWRDFLFGFGGIMAVLRHLRFSWVVLAAIVGNVSTAKEALANPVGQDCAPTQMSCCVTPSPSSCCCDSSTPINRFSERASQSEPEGSARAAARVASTDQRGTCQCRPSDPARLPSKSDRRSTNERTDAGHGKSLATSAADSGSAAPFIRPALPHASPLKTPFYLRTGHLLI